MNWRIVPMVNSLSIVVDEENREVCRVMPKQATLIAAAPKLLEALRRCADYLDCIPESAAGGDDEAGRLTREARRSIAQATEEEDASYVRIVR